MESTETDVEECNIGSEEEPKMIKLFKTLPLLIKIEMHWFVERVQRFVCMGLWGFEVLWHKHHLAQDPSQGKPKTIQVEIA